VQYFKINPFLFLLLFRAPFIVRRVLGGIVKKRRESKA
jgi:hypothetical protein